MKYHFTSNALLEWPLSQIVRYTHEMLGFYLSERKHLPKSVSFSILTQYKVTKLPELLEVSILSITFALRTFNFFLAFQFAFAITSNVNIYLKNGSIYVVSNNNYYLDPINMAILKSF